jgi:hypothetical protein
MSRLNNISHKLFLLVLCIMVVSACTKKRTFQTEVADEEVSYEERIAELDRKLNQLPKYCDPAEFMPIYKELVPLFENYSDKLPKTANVRNTVIQKLLDIGVYGQAIRQSYLALEANNISVVDDSIYHNLMIYGKLNYLFEKTESIDSVFGMCETAIYDAKKHSDPFWLSSALNNAGQFFHKHGKVQTALNYLSQADSILNILNQNSQAALVFQGNVRNNLANIYVEQKKFIKARDIYAFNFNQRYVNARGTTPQGRRISNGISLAGMEIHFTNLNQAKKILDQTGLLLDSLVHHDKIRYEIDFLHAKIDYYIATDNSEDGFSESKRLMLLKDSLARWDKNLKNRTMSLLANFSSSQFEIALEQEKEARQLYEQQSKLRLWIIFMVVLGAVALTVSLIRFQKQRVKLFKTDKLLSEEKLKRQEQKQQLLGLQLENKKKDLTDMALSLQQKQQWAKELNVHINKVNSERGYKRSRELKKLQEEIRSNVYVDKNLELIQQNINILSHEFFDKLNNSFPNLSKGENKLCSYIKLNLSTSQIAQLQNVDPASVKMSRYRLKKKFNLGTNQKLDIFIQNFDL